MASLKRAARNSLNSVIDGESDADRLREIHAVGKASQRVALLAVHATVNKFPRTTARLLGMKLPKDLVKLDAGLQSEVFRVEGNDTVLKIVKEHDGYNNPVLLSRMERRRFAAEMTEQHAMMAGYAGKSVLPHEISVGEHPFYRGREAIRVVQPYREIEFVAFSDYGLNIDEATGTGELTQRLQTIGRSHPGFIIDLSTFVGGSTAMAREQGLVTDVVGRNGGIDTATGRLVFVDSQPVPPSRPEEQQFALYHLERLESAVSDLAAA